MQYQKPILPKNLSLLNDLLDSLIKSIDITDITETKRGALSADNVDLANYSFFQYDSLTGAGGAGIYVNKDLQAVSRSDIKFNVPLVESCWIELQSRYNKPNVIIGCIYKSPTANLHDFTYELDRIRFFSIITICKYAFHRDCCNLLLSILFLEGH